MHEKDNITNFYVILVTRLSMREDEMVLEKKSWVPYHGKTFVPVEQSEPPGHVLTMALVRKQNMILVSRYRLKATQNESNIVIKSKFR